MTAEPGATGEIRPAIGIVANPASGKDIRRLIANAPTSTLAEKYSIVRRSVIGAAEVGVKAFYFLPEPHRICSRAVETLSLDATYHHAAIDERYNELDTVHAVQVMREAGCAAIITLGGDGTNRAATLGWREAPLLPISTGTNNVFPNFVEATVAGEAAGLVAAGHVSLSDVATQAKVVEVDVDDEPADLALIDAVLVNERFVGSRALFDADALRVAVMTRAEPAAVGISSIGGLLHPVDAQTDGGLCLRFSTQPGSGRLRAPIAPGLYQTIPIGSFAPLELEETVEVTGPGILAFDGERQRALAAGQRARLRITRTGPLVIDPARALRLAAQEHTFVHETGS